MKTLLEGFTALFEQEPGEAVAPEIQPDAETPAPKRKTTHQPKPGDGIFFALPDPAKEMSADLKGTYYELNAPFLVGLNPTHESITKLIEKALEDAKTAGGEPDTTEIKKVVNDLYGKMSSSFVSEANKVIAGFNSKSDQDAEEVRAKFGGLKSRVGEEKIIPQDVTNFKAKVLGTAAARSAYAALVDQVTKTENKDEVASISRQISGSRLKEINFPNPQNIAITPDNFVIALTILGAHSQEGKAAIQKMLATMAKGTDEFRNAMSDYMNAVAKGGLVEGEIDNWLKTRSGSEGAEGAMQDVKSMYLVNVKWGDQSWIRDILDAADEPTPVGGISRSWEHALTKYNAYAMKQSGADVPIMELGEFGDLKEATGQIDTAVDAIVQWYQKGAEDLNVGVIPPLPSISGTLLVRMDKEFAETPPGKEASLLQSDLAQSIEGSIRTDVKRIFRHEESVERKESMKENANQSEPKSAEIADGRERDIADYLTFMKDSLVPFINKETPAPVEGSEVKEPDYAAVALDMESGLSMMGAEKAGEVSKDIEPSHVQGMVASMLPDNGVVVFSPKPQNSDAPQLWIVVRDGWGIHVRGLYLVNGTWQMGAPFAAKRPVRSASTAIQAMLSQGAFSPLYALPFRYVDRRSVLLTT